MHTIISIRTKILLLTQYHIRVLLEYNYKNKIQISTMKLIARDFFIINYKLIAENQKNKGHNK